MLPWLWIFALFWGYSSLVWGQMGVPYFDVAMKTSIKVFNQNVLSEVRIFWLDQIWSKFWAAAFDLCNCQFFFIIFFCQFFFQQILFGRILPIFLWFFFNIFIQGWFLSFYSSKWGGRFEGYVFFRILNATIGFGQFFSEIFFWIFWILNFGVSYD